MRYLPLVLASLAVPLLALPSAARAERADRNKPMIVEADRDGVVDLQKQVLVYTGNVVISQGSMLLRAERIELREMADGYRAATATGTQAKQPSWRQRRDGVDEVVEGNGDRIEYDGRADTVRFIGNGVLRRWRNGTLADEVTGAAIAWDNTNEVFRVEGGVSSAANPSGRVRAVLSPRGDAASEPASGAAATAPLAPSRNLRDKR